jgi:D-tyrosyl-tRNA(Tyr) deacylase
MKAVIQRVKNAAVYTEGKLLSSIQKGYCILIGFEVNDDEEKLKKMIDKIAKIRLFGEKFEKNIQDVKGEILLVSNFTIPAITKKGTKPNFKKSLNSVKAKEFYDKMLIELNKKIPTKSGKFGAMMEVSINNDGPVTVILEV